MTLDALHNEWAKDQELALDQPDKMIREVPLLHAKYWRIFSDERNRYLNLKQEYDILKRQKSEWLLGRMSEEERKELGWEPQPLRIVRQELDHYLNSDTDLLPYVGKLELQKHKMAFLEDCIKSINNRNFLIRSWIDWLKFSQGA